MTPSELQCLALLTVSLVLVDATFAASVAASAASATASSAASATASSAASAASATASTTASQPKASVLFVAPVGSKSHKNFYYGIIEAVASAGHEVTLLTPYPPSRTIPNVQEVIYEFNDISEHMINPFAESNAAFMMKMTTAGPDMCLKALAATNITKPVFEKKYDLAFLAMFCTECFLPEIHTKKIPFVFVSPAGMVGSFAGNRVGSPTFPSIDKHPLVAHNPPYSFLQRALVLAVDLAMLGFQRYSYWSMESQGEALGLYPPNSPSLSEISAEASLTIANSYRLAEHPKPYMPNILLVGGIHLRPPKPLPKELEDWVQSAGKDGIIFFSLGSAVRATDLPESTVSMMGEVFSSLPQKVLWKYDRQDIAGGLPKNVRLTKWAPQQDLLGHPSMRLFISHGGILSTQEATYHGVPVLGLPVFGDQKGNMRSAELQGWGKMLTWDELTPQLLKSTIQQLINDPEKRANVKKLGALMRDRPYDPASDVAWWTGYLVRTGGAKHLRSTAVDIPWWQLYNTDIWLLVTSVALLATWLAFKILLKICSWCCGSKSRKQPQGKKLKRS